eukprot:TRINITY_DN5350_c0_g4_i1.p1 TRINITY_DN5350_c0_g4~~TRINITY_DN5350_c0_g4_i1.p1  ORF type:complete len:143 (-),score=10.83 TRINITY_DN5350_c0_g4_i1:528-956(-)
MNLSTGKVNGKSRSDVLSHKNLQLLKTSEFLTKEKFNNYADLKVSEIIHKHNKFIGYSKRFHAVVSPQARLEKLSQGLPEILLEQIKSKIKNEINREVRERKYSQEHINRLTAYPVLRPRKLSNKFQKEYDKIFFNSDLNST